MEVEGRECIEFSYGGEVHERKQGCGLKSCGKHLQQLYHIIMEYGQVVQLLDYVRAQSCLTFCYPMDCSPSGSSVLGILQARILEWVARESF